jgi:uncharacterized membrane protein YadS
MPETADYAFLTATTLPITGYVNIAAAAGGKACLEMAGAIKMARTALIILLAPLLAAFAAEPGEKTRFGGVPWFLFAFVAVGIVSSFVPGLREIIIYGKDVSTICFASALAGIGLGVNIRETLPLLPKTLAIGAAGWAGMVAVAAIGRLLLGYRL